jgi:hypothetical protein
MLALPLVAIPAVAADDPAAAPVKSVFAADRPSSEALGLVPDDASHALRFPAEPVVLSWSPVPGAVSYRVLVSDSPSFTTVRWSGETDQTSIAPTELLADGAYWWRVVATDAAGTRGVASRAARFAKSWPNEVSGTTVSDAPGGPAATVIGLQPYFTWSPVPGAKEYELQIAPADGFATPALAVQHVHATFFTPGVLTVLPDDGYQWRVRARDAAGHPGQWSVPGQFTKAWSTATPLEPAPDASVGDVFLRWAPVPGAETYDVQLTQIANTWVGNGLKIGTSTTNTALVPTDGEEQSSAILPGDAWWRVRPVVKGVPGTWSPVRHMVVAPAAVTGPAAVLTPAADSDSALTPHLRWSPVTGATIYRVDIATDASFNNIVESQTLRRNAWASRKPLPDNQVGAGYFWRVVWGTGSADNPNWQIDEAVAPRGMFSKQTRVTLATGDGSLVSEPPLLSWAGVPGAAKYQLQLGRDPSFDNSSEPPLSATIYSLGVVPGAESEGARPLVDGTWHWRVRAIDGAGLGQTWSPVGRFTLTAPQPVPSSPADGDAVVGSPVLRWAPVPEACGYDVQLKDGPALTEADAVVSTAQTALVPTGQQVTKPGRWHWRVRADLCDDAKGQWSPVRAFRSVAPPDFGLNAVSTRVGYGTPVVVSGGLRFGGAAVTRPTLRIERRLWPERDYAFIGTVNGDARGRFAFRLQPRRTASYRLRWVTEAGVARGEAAFALQVVPRVTMRLGAPRVVRRGSLKVTGSVFPARPAVIQARTSEGWQTVRKLSLKRPRFTLKLRAALEPGSHRLRLLVPGDRRLGTARTAARALLVYDRFVIAGGKRGR